MKPKDTPTRFLTTNQVAELTGLRPQTLINWRCTGRAGPAYVRLSRKRVRYDRAEIERWIRQHTVAAVA